MEEAEVLELYELHYRDLMQLSSSLSNDNNGSSQSAEELQRLENVKSTIMEILGPKGPGLLSITGVPNASLLRRNLLPLACELAFLDNESRKRILKEHNLGSDVPLKSPDRNVSSFAMQLRYEEALESHLAKPRHSLQSCSGPDNLDFDGTQSPHDEFTNLADTFKELGYCMMQLGLRLAQICDKATGDQELERSLLESGTAKGRLIHYHSDLDKLLLKAAERRKGSAKKQAKCKKDQVHLSRGEQNQLVRPNLMTNDNKSGSSRDPANLWQQWHYDYGIFTVLAAPMFLVPSQISENMVMGKISTLRSQECPSPGGNSYLQIFDPIKNDVLMVKTSPESFIIQVGESADILSKRKLRSTLHCVCKPAKLEDVSRETFVVFLQPAWSKTFSISDGIMDDPLSDEGNGQHDRNEFASHIHKIVPPLSSRLKDGMTFADFSRATTKQYYGGGGLQSSF